MATRTISLSEDAYQGLLAMQQPGESLSDTVRRLTRRRSLTELGSVMDRQAAESVARAIDSTRSERLARRQQRLGRD